MALATTCPRCRTSFKVVPDQLKLRRGLVRCGACRHVFSGIDSLRYVEDPSRRDAATTGAVAPSATATVPASAATDHSPTPPASIQRRDGDASIEPTFPGSHHVGSTPADAAQAHPSSADAAVDTAASEAAPAASDEHTAIGQAPFERVEPTPGQTGSGEAGSGEAGSGETGSGETESGEAERLDAAATGTPEAPGGATIVSPPDEDAQADTPAQVRPGADGPTPSARADAGDVLTADGADEADAVDFFGSQRRVRGFATRGTAMAWVAAVVLAVMLVVQLTIGGRDWLAASMPTLRPIIATAVAPLGLQVQPPQSLSTLTIESFELSESGVPGLFGMSALLRNGASHPVRWPSLELTLVDGAGSIVARRVLSPQDYLGGAVPAQQLGVPANAEQPVRGALQTRDIAPTGYSVKVFYP